MKLSMDKIKCKRKGRNRQKLECHAMKEEEER